MTSSIYAPLQGESREFRLLVLEPSTNRLAPVRCKLNLESFDDGDLKYTALSYAWGDPLETAPVIVNDIETQVTLNLEAALRHIRQATCAVTLWVDALCINQEDVAEKNHQVEMMREIYSGAELVIAWLGSASGNSDYAMKVLGSWIEDRETQHESARVDELGYHGSSMANDKHMEDKHTRGYEEYLATPPAQNPASVLRETISGRQLPSQDTPTDLEVIGSLSDIDDAIMIHSGMATHFSRQGSKTRTLAIMICQLLTRSWWSRIWVVQEVLLARTLLFKCGDAEISEDQLRTWTSDKTGCLITALSNDGILDDQVMCALGLLQDLHNPTEDMDTAMDYLSIYGSRRATRPHDHIYGLLGVIPREDRMLLGTPDYDCRIEDLFINVTTKLMVKHNSLELLLQTGIPQSLTTTTSTKMDLPSWVPDWTRTDSMHTFRNHRSGTLDTISEPSFHISEDAKELVLEAFKFDTIESVKSVPALGQGKMPIWQADLTTNECAAEGGQPPLHMLIVTLCLPWTGLERLDDEDGQGFSLVASFFRELEEYYIPGRREASDGHDNRGYLSGFLEWIGETRDERTDEEILEKIFSVEAARSFVKWYHGSTSEDLRNSYWVYTGFRQGLGGSAGWLVFRTYKGSFGIMEAVATVGDILCVVPSCWVMLVFRKTQSSKYFVVGPSSPIVGALHGEVTQAIGRGEITKESFTLV